MAARRLPSPNSTGSPFAAQHDNRTVITDDKVGTFAGITGDVLTAGPDAHLAPTHYQDWIQAPQ